MTIEIDPLTGAPIIKSDIQSIPSNDVKQTGLENDNNTELLDSLALENDYVSFDAQVEVIVKGKMSKIKDVLRHKMDSQQLHDSMKQIESILLAWE